ncbi:MAG: adenylate/guanylate cyclase domain-containing protein [Alphaproteobacteria bacterium]|nr:adenylate/guanylate cyclase domain-containing protein [Alphaproteobacteria bacterium]
MTSPAAQFCAACGAGLVPAARFCAACGAALASAPAPTMPAGERREVTVLFADLAAFTRLSATRDPEDMHRLLNRLFAVVDRIVIEHGGTVDKHMGDAVMALFGAPVAHDNDPERAVRTAIALHGAVAELGQEERLPLALHIGVNSGVVVASAVGGSGHESYTVTGAR